MSTSFMTPHFVGKIHISISVSYITHLLKHQFLGRVVDESRAYLTSSFIRVATSFMIFAFSLTFTADCSRCLLSHKSVSTCSLEVNGPPQFFNFFNIIKRVSSLLTATVCFSVNFAENLSFNPFLGCGVSCVCVHTTFFGFPQFFH